MKKFVIVGSGRQGIAVAYDLLRNKNHHVTMVDINQSFLTKASTLLSVIKDSFISDSNIELSIKEENFIGHPLVVG